MEIKQTKITMNILVILASVFLSALAQLLMRKGMLDIGEVGMGNFVSHIVPMITNIWLWLAMLSYAVSVLLWLSVLSKVEVSFAYAFSSVGYILVATAGYLFFHEDMSAIRIVGIVVVCIGVVLISQS